MFINKKEKFSIRKFKDGRSDSVKIGTVGLIVGAALAMAGQAQTVEAAMKENSDNTTTISNDKGSVIVETANIENPNEGREFSTDPTAEGINTIIKTGKVDYKYVTAEGNTVLEENKNQNSGVDKTIETEYNVFGKSGEVFKETTGGSVEDSDLDGAKEKGKKETIEKDGKTYHLIGESKVENTGNGGGVYSDTTLGDVTAKLTPEGLSNAEGKITYDTVKAGGKAWIVEQTGKGTYGKYVLADSGAITSDDKMIEAFKAGETAAKYFNSANVTADGGIKEGDYVFVLEKNTYVTVKAESLNLTGSIQLSSSDNVADDVDGTGATLNRTYAMVQNFKAAPDTLTGVANKTLVKGYLAYLQEKGVEDNLLNFKRYITLGIEAKAGNPLAISADNGDQVDAKGRPTSDITADMSSVSNQDTLELEGGDFLLRLSSPSPNVEEYSYRDEITPLRAYRLASGTTTITYTYAEEKTREIEKKGSVVVNYQTEDGTELKAPYTDTPETVVEVVTEHYYVNADGEEVVVEDKTVRTPKNVAYNTKENETEKPQKLTDAQGNVYYLNEANTTTSVNDTETTSPAEEGTLVEGVTKVTYIYEKAGSVIVNYKTEDGTPLIGTVVDEDGAGKTVESGAKDTDNGKPGTAYNTADNGMKPTRIKTAEGKVYELIPESTEGEPEGEVESGVTKEVTYIYKEVKGNVVVKYEDTEGNSLADDEQDETDASLNVKYDTTDHKKESIEKDGVKYYLTTKELKDGYKETGDVVEGTTEVTYVYEKAGSVIVNYQTEYGTPLVGTADGANVESGAKDTTDAKAGTDYNTADNGMKPNRITTAEGKVYELVPTATKGDETGKVVAGETKEVTYVYKEVKGNVIVKFQDTEGNPIADDENDETNASLNTNYNTSEHKKATIVKDGVTYYLTDKALKDGSKPATGDVVEGTTTVTYVYEKAGQVVVNYQTEDGTSLVGVDPDGANVASGTKDTVDGRPGSDYNTSDNGMKPNRITTAEGKVYELVPESTKGDETGKVVAGEMKEVTYVYKEVTGDVVVHYVDTEGNVIAEDKEDTKGASLNAKYDTTDNKPEKIEKDGTVYYLTEKALKDDSKPENGDVVEGKTEVTYVYEKAGSVIVNYQTEEGTPLVGTAEGKDIDSGVKDTVDGRPGSDYNTADNGMKPTRITTAEGKVYELVPALTKGDETGKVVAGETKEVTYVYKEVKGNVVVKYEDTEGNVLAEDEKDETDASLNVKYDTADHKKDEIIKDGVKYYLTAKELKDGSKPATGDVVEGTTTVTYVYEKAGQVVVNYQTEDGTSLVGVDPDGANVASGTKDTVDGRPGSDYNTSDNGMKPNRITTPEGKVYELLPQSTKGEETGKVKAGETTEVTYVYKEITGNVVVHYVDTEGNTLADDTKDVENGSLSDKYDTTDNKPAKLEKDGQVYYLTAKELKDGSKPENGAVVEGTTEITYVYEKAGQVVVHYTDEKGNTIQVSAVATKDGKPGAAYNTADNDMKPNRITTPEGKVYELLPQSTKGEETGKVKAGETTEVTYVYKEITGNVVVHYVDTEGNTLADDTKDVENGSLSDKYDTTDNKPAKLEKDGQVYYLTAKELKDGSKPENGAVVEGTTEITYVYEKAGQVVVHYVDEAGNTLQADAVDTKDGKPGAAYNTADNDMKPTRITTPEGKVYELVPASTKGNETGDVEAGKTTEVTYVYKEVKGNVVVHYVDEAGNTIAEDVKDTTDGSVSSAYDTTDNKLVTITTKDGKKYALVPTATKGSENGKVTEETVEVTYVYKEVTGDVVVHYVDTEGNVIAEDKEDTKGASLNAKYDTTDNKPEKIEKDGTVYYLTEKALKDDSKPENGDVVEGKTEVTYVYEKAGQVVVHYTDEKGNTIQADAVDTKDGKPNADYNTADNDMKPNRITTAEGKVYELVPESTKGDETGKVVAGEMKEVTYVYKEVTGDVVVHYVDTEGNVIAEDKEDTKGASLNAKYDTTDNKPEKIEKDGTVYYLTEKALKDDSKPENGDVVEGKTEVTYVYEKAGQVVVHYTDEKGNTIQVSAVATKDSKPGAAYNTTDKDLKPTRITNPEGKVYELVPASTKGNENGSVEAGKTTEVTYVYKEVKGNVVVHYTDEAGNTIAEDVKDTTDGSINSAYDTSDNKLATITTKDGKKYVLVPTSTKGEESGKVTEGTTEVTYVYKEVTGDVVVRYVDTEGNVIAEDKEDTKGASLNAKYDTTDNKLATIEKDGVKYYLTEKAVKDDSKPETGDVVEGKTEVTYVYEKAGQVVVHYVDETGNTLQADAVDTKDGKPGAKYDTSDNDMKPTRITTPEGKVFELVPASTNGDETGYVEAGKTTEVNYIYKEVKGNVVVHYVDEAGNTIAEDVKDITDGSISSAYDTTDNKLATITTKDGKKYALVPTATKGSENGKVTEGTTEVTYVYKEVKEDSTNGGSPTPSQPGSQARPSTNPTSPVKPTDPSQPETPVVPTDPSQPTTPANPANPANPAGPVTPTMPSAPENGEAPQAPAASSEAKGQAELPNTGTEDNASLAALGLLGVLSGFGLVARKKKED